MARAKKTRRSYSERLAVLRDRHLRTLARYQKMLADRIDQIDDAELEEMSIDELRQGMRLVTDSLRVAVMPELQSAGKGTKGSAGDGASGGAVDSPANDGDDASRTSEQTPPLRLADIQLVDSA